MGRTATQPRAPAAEPALNHDAIEALGTKSTELVSLQAEQAEKAITLARQIGYEGALTVGTLEDEIRFYQRRTVEAILETGKRLLLLKELTPHGEFTKRVDLLGLSDRTAQRFMQAAAKTAKSANLAVLATQVKSGSAFLELITHDDDVLEGLQEMDDFDRMSASQLRQKARELEADLKASADVMAGKDRKLNELARRAKKFDVDVELPAAFNEARAAATDAVNAIMTGLQKLEDLRDQAMNKMRPDDEHGQEVHLGELQTLGMLMYGGYATINAKLKATETVFNDTLEQLLAD
jgi:hypothetical protein